MSSTTESPRSVMPTNVGYLVGSIVKADGQPSPEIEWLHQSAQTEWAKTLPKEMGFEKVFLGPTLKQYEYAKGTPNMTFVMKFASKAKAQEFYAMDTYQEWMAKLGIGTKILRDVRIIEAPDDLFVPGRAYWLAFIRGQPDPVRNMKYIGACNVDANMTTEPFDVALADGTVAKTSLSVKWVGGSDFKEAAVDVLPTKEAATDFFGHSTADGIVVVGEFPTHAQGAGWKDCLQYKNALLKSMDESYSTDEAYEASLQTFMVDIFQRDVRILGM